MTNLATQSGFDAGAYLAREEHQPEKHEYLTGEVFAMVGSMREHVVPSRRVETFRRTSDQDWLFLEHRSELGDCHIPAVEVSIPFDEIFENLGPDDSGLGGHP